MNWSVFLAAALMLAAPGSEECSTIQAAHQALLESSFTAERHFTLVMNGELKARQKSRVTYSDGQLATETLSQELLRKNLVLEEEDTLSVLTLPLDCQRLVRTADGRFELTSADETEKAIFELRDGEEALRPVSWSSNERVRFLWRKLQIEAMVTYRDFSWR